MLHDWFSVLLMWSLWLLCLVVGLICLLWLWIATVFIWWVVYFGDLLFTVVCCCGFLACVWDVWIFGV